MKEMYERYPDALFVDTTYCLNNIKYPALAMVVQDELGNSYPVCIILLDKTVAILIDKDLKEDEMLSKNFPNARILYCVWYVLKTFKKNYATGSKEKSLLKRMTYSLTEDEYNKNLNEFNNVTNETGLK
jgi:zinc finger SWIM domain-containing protein 3